MVRKVRLCRAVEANVGERRAYKKQLVRIQRDFQNYVLGEIFTELERQNALAYDEKLPKNDELKALKGKTLKRLRRGSINEVIVWFNDHSSESSKPRSRRCC